jgi:hypothetical protein
MTTNILRIRNLILMEIALIPILKGYNNGIPFIIIVVDNVMMSCSSSEHCYAISLYSIDSSVYL